VRHTANTLFFPGLLAGTYDVFVQAANGSLGGSVRATVVPGRLNNAHVLMVPMPEVVGSVVDAAGVPVANAQLFYTDPLWPTEVASRWGSAWTNAHGEFLIHVPSGKLGKVRVKCRDGITRHALRAKTGLFILN